VEQINTAEQADTDSRDERLATPAAEVHALRATLDDRQIYDVLDAHV
jgi:hypothetical protein